MADLVQIALQQGKREGLKPENGFVLGSGTVLILSSGSVVDFKGDAIVNAANTGCLGGGGVDGAVSSAGGPQLKKAREALPLLDNRGKRCETGDAKITVGGSLKAKWCIHAVGPNYRVLESKGNSQDECDKLLHDAYVAAMQRAQEVRASTVAFSLLSSGIFRGSRSLQDVLRIGVEAVAKAAYSGLSAVHLVGFTREELEILQEAAMEVLPKMQTDIAPTEPAASEPEVAAPPEPEGPAAPQESSHSTSPEPVRQSCSVDLALEGTMPECSGSIVSVLDVKADFRPVITRPKSISLSL